jgi:hypothetical protein
MLCLVEFRNLRSKCKPARNGMEGSSQKTSLATSVARASRPLPEQNEVARFKPRHAAILPIALSGPPFLHRPGYYQNKSKARETARPDLILCDTFNLQQTHCCHGIVVAALCRQAGFEMETHTANTGGRFANRAMRALTGRVTPTQTGYPTEF